MAQTSGVVLRQSYAQVDQAAELLAGRYAHAKQFRRMHREIKKPSTWLGRVIRDVQRKTGEIAGEAAGEISADLRHKLAIAERLHAQKLDSKNKLLALHAPEVECIAKGKARTPYEFGVKVSVAVTAHEVLVVGMRSMPGHPYDGHTVDSQLEQVEIVTGQAPKLTLVDRGYCGVTPASGVPTSDQPHAAPAGQAQVTQASSGGRTHDRAHEGRRLAWQELAQGSIGDALHAILRGAGHNLRMILAHLRVLYGAAFANLVRATLIDIRASRQLDLRAST